MDIGILPHAKNVMPTHLLSCRHRTGISPEQVLALICKSQLPATGPQSSQYAPMRSSVFHGMIVPRRRCRINALPRLLPDGDIVIVLDGHDSIGGGLGRYNTKEEINRRCPSKLKIPIYMPSISQALSLSLRKTGEPTNLDYTSRITWR